MWHVDMNKLSYNFHNKCITNKLNSILNVNTWSVISYFSIAQLSEAITHEFHGSSWSKSHKNDLSLISQKFIYTYLHFVT